MKAKPRRPATCAGCCAPNSASSSEEVVFLCTVLNIPNKEWQNAVEGILGRNRFTILVPPAHYDAAMKLYRERRHKDGLHSVALLDTERILASKTKPGTRNALCHLKLPPIIPPLAPSSTLLLGHYVKCDTLEELRDHRTAITRECFVRRNYTDSHINPHIYGRWFIGERAVTSQVENRQQRLDEIAKEMLSLNERDAALRERLALTRDKIRPLIDLEHALEAFSILPERTSQHEALKQELEALDLRTTETLQADVEQHQAEYKRLQTEAGSVERRIGGMEADAQTLAEGEIPRLESEIDQSIQNAEDISHG